MTNTTVDRFQVLSHNELTFPHKCGTCGSFSGDNGKQYIDFGLFVEFYGNVYICTECFYGAISKPNDQSKAQVRELKAVVTTLIAENRTLRDAIDDLRGSVTSSPNTNTNSVHLEPSPAVEARPDRRTEEPEISSANPAGVNPVGEEREAGSVEQVNVGGSPHVRKNDSDDSLLIGLDTLNL